MCNSGFVKNFFKIINCLIYVIKINSIYKVVLNKSKINFCPSFDTVTDLKKINIKNLYYSKPLSKNLSHLNKKSSSSTVLLIGNLRSTFMINSLIELSNNLINNLARLKKSTTFELELWENLNLVMKFKISLIIRGLNSLVG